MSEPKIFQMSFLKTYQLYLAKAKRKERTEAEVNQIIYWLTGYSESELASHLILETTIQDFFEQAPQFNENASLIKGRICGIKVEEISDSLMQKIRYLDKLIDELAQGRSMDKILRK
ncbi:DUF2200 domain-containing protein [Erysipelotrichaceae bacterium OttesenSCG-928-M19]|nr:DUF2200 domain-containing protein [Erysipelotrichaceae bacterium OttesenSCG-928-M19]